MKRSRLSLWVLAIALGLASCGEAEKTEEETSSAQKVDPAIIEGEQTLHTTLGDELFSVPSPVMMAVLLKEQGGEYDEKMLHDPEKHSEYLTREKRAMNLGVMGTDLAFASIHEKNQDAMNYMATVDKMAEQLGLSSAIDDELLERFAANATEQDSMVVLVSEAYRRSDEHLKENDHKDLSALILVGGWVEAVYLATNSAIKTGAPEIKSRVGEQLATAKTIRRILNKLESEELQPIVDKFNELNSSFSMVETNYEYVEPETFADEHLTVIKSKSSVVMTDVLLSQLATKITEIRNLIIQ